VSRLRFSSVSWVFSTLLYWLAIYLPHLLAPGDSFFPPCMCQKFNTHTTPVWSYHFLLQQSNMLGKGPRRFKREKQKTRQIKRPKKKKNQKTHLGSHDAKVSSSAAGTAGPQWITTLQKWSEPHQPALFCMSAGSRHSAYRLTGGFAPSHSCLSYMNSPIPAGGTSPGSPQPHRQLYPCWWHVPWQPMLLPLPPQVPVSAGMWHLTEPEGSRLLNSDMVLSLLQPGETRHYQICSSALLLSHMFSWGKWEAEPFK